jgi:hypothetical protein
MGCKEYRNLGQGASGEGTSRSTNGADESYMQMTCIIDPRSEIAGYR